MTVAYVHAIVDAGAVPNAASEIADLEAVTAAHTVTGDFDVIAQLELEDPDELPRVVAEEIHGVSGVVDTVTNVAFEP